MFFYYLPCSHLWSPPPSAAAHALRAGRRRGAFWAARRLLRCVFEFWFIVNALNCASYGEPDVRPAGRPDGRVRGHTQSGGDTHRRLSREASDQRERLVHIRAEARTGTRAVAGGRVFGVAPLSYGLTGRYVRQGALKGERPALRIAATVCVAGYCAWVKPAGWPVAPVVGARGVYFRFNRLSASQLL